LGSVEAAKLPPLPEVAMEVTFLDHTPFRRRMPGSTAGKMLPYGLTFTGKADSALKLFSLPIISLLWV